jgi:parallel beta-helix repeat protein
MKSGGGERGRVGNGFLEAFSVDRGDANVVRNIQGWEVRFTRSTGGVIARSHLQQGFYLERDHRLRVVHNKVSGGPSTSTLEVHDSSRITVKGNDVFNAHRGIWFDDVDHSRVLNNRVNMADEPAIWLMRHSNGNRVAGNLLYRGDFGGFNGIDLQVSSRNLVVHNIVRDAAYAIAVGQPDPFFAEFFGRGISRDNVVGANVARRSGVGVIAVKGGSEDTLIEGNVAKLGGTGIRVGGPSTGVGDNLVKKNAGYGISAIRGTRSLGGNVAIRNKGRPQCVHVRCRTVPPAS